MEQIVLPIASLGAKQWSTISDLRHFLQYRLPRVRTVPIVTVAAGEYHEDYQQNGVNPQGNADRQRDCIKSRSIQEPSQIIDYRQAKAG